MFYLTKLTKELSLNPIDLGFGIKELIKIQVRNIENQIIGEHGYVVLIVEFSYTDKGTVEKESGNVSFKINYNAIIFKPIKDEIVDCVVVMITEYGYFCRMGPVKVFVSRCMIDNNWEYLSEENVWKNDERVIIEKNSIVRLKLVAVKINSNEITALGKKYEGA